MEVPGWMTAVGTATLAVFAIVTAIYAIRAFRAQSMEVRDQAENLRIQSERLAEQRKINAEQMKVLALQAAELHESLQERKHEAVERRSAQASRVSIITNLVRITPKRTDTGFRLNVTVVNNSEQKQPVYRTRLYWYIRGEPYGIDNPESLGTVLESANTFRDFMPGSNPDSCGAILTFRDAAGIDWIRTADGAIMTGESHLAFDLAKSLFTGSELTDSPDHNIS